MPANYQKLRPEQCTSAVLLQKKSNAAVLPFKSLKEVLKLCSNALDKHIDHYICFNPLCASGENLRPFIVTVFNTSYEAK